MSSRRKKKGKRTGRFLRFLVILFLGALAGGYFYIDSLAYKVCRVEAGVEVRPSDFLKQADEDAVFTENSDSFSIYEPGEYKVWVKSGWFLHRATLIVEDTVAPRATLCPVNLEYGQVCSAGDFVEQILDATSVAVGFNELPDFGQLGRQQVQVRLTDAGGNTTVLETELCVFPVHTEISCEVGGNPPMLADFLTGDVSAVLHTNLEGLSLEHVTDHEVVIEVDGENYRCVLHVVDTVPPVLTLKNVAGYTLVPRTAEEFVAGIEDWTNVTVSFVQEPDLTLAGEQQVQIMAEDEGGNQTVGQAVLTLQADTESPRIVGAKDITVYVGSTVSYRKDVEVTDNCPEGLNLEIDNSQVNLSEAGSYPVIYRATDYAGNVTEQAVTVTVKASLYTQEQIDELADAVLAKIITEDMTPMEKVQAIFNYIRGHVGYINHSEKDDWIRAAYEGLAEGQGDCYVFACTSKQLLTRAGITNMDIAKIPAKTSHYWNLVDIGDGWYHFDTTPRKDHPTIFMWTDEQMMEYSAAHNNSHNYDHDAYPEVN